ncbi:AAA family ATPase [Aestuariivirga sp.]|uniref:AAA family ATPase n=1 Tax=Aestuariivirga sp. TaxID=2650926 RepID=UPI00391DFC5C
MKLTGVSVEGCGRFGTPARIEGFGPGVNILAAENEAGKSTLFRAIRTCLFERHSSAKEEIAALATEGLSLPVSITVSFECGGKSYAIAKSFLKGKAASLTCGGVEIARNSEADERVWELLGISPKSARALDDAAFGIVWVQQGHSFQAPEPSEAAKTVLNEVIQQEVGTLVGGERARLLLSAVREELARNVTDTGRHRANGPLDLAAKESARLGDERMEVEGRLAELNDRIEGLARLRAELRRAGNPADTRQMKQELADAQQKLGAAEKAAEALKALEAEERHAHERASAQREKLDALRRRAEGIDGHRRRIKALVAGLPALDEEEAAARNAQGEALRRRSKLDLEIEELESRESGLQRLAALATHMAARDQMETRLNQLRDFNARAAANEAELKVASADDAALQALAAIEQQESALRARIEAAAARISIAAGPAAQVAVNGEAVSGNATRAVTEPLAITVGRDVTITVSPPAAGVAAAEEGLKEQRRRLADLLARHGAKNPEELRQFRAQRLLLEETARELRAERNALGLKEQPSAEIARLENALAEIDAKMRQAAEGSAAGSIPSPAELQAELQAIAEARGALRSERTGCDAVAAGQNETLSRIAKARGTLDGQLREIHAKLEADLALLPDEQRESMINACQRDLEAREAEHRGKAALCEERRRQSPQPEETERLKARAERLSSALDNRAGAIDRLNQQIARLEGEIQSAGGDGLGERAAALKLQQEMAAAEAARIAERVEVLNLLKSTVERCYARRREQLNAPLLRHLKPFLHDVFPQAEIALGENFTIAGLNRGGPGRELFGRLSLGTQEQIAVLVRLAMGAMICEKGEDVPIILDDALVFSDDDRIEQMFDALNRAGRNQQVIVLTCRSRSFASLGGRQLQIV